MCERDSRWDYSSVDNKPEMRCSNKDPIRNEFNRSSASSMYERRATYESSARQRSRSPVLSGRRRYRSPSPKHNTHSPLPRHTARMPPSRHGAHSPPRSHSAQSPPRYRCSSPSLRHRDYSPLPRHGSCLSPKHGSYSPSQRPNVSSPSPPHRYRSPSPRYGSYSPLSKYRSHSPTSMYNYYPERKDCSSVEDSQQNPVSGKESREKLFSSQLQRMPKSSDDDSQSQRKAVRCFLKELTERLGNKQENTENYISHQHNLSINDNKVTYYKDNTNASDSYLSKFSSNAPTDKDNCERAKSKIPLGSDLVYNKYSTQLPLQSGFSNMHENTAGSTLKNGKPLDKKEASDKIIMLYRKYEKELQALSSRSSDKDLSSEQDSDKNITDVTTFNSVTSQLPADNANSEAEFSAKSNEVNNQNSKMPINAQPPQTDLQHLPLVSYPNQSQTLGANYKATSLPLHMSSSSPLNPITQGTPPLSSVYQLPQVAYPQMNSQRSNFAVPQHSKFPIPSPVPPPQPVPPVTNTTVGAAGIACKTPPLASFNENSPWPQSGENKKPKEPVHSFPSELRPNYASNLSQIALDILKENQQARLKAANEGQHPSQDYSIKESNHQSWIRSPYKELPNKKRFRGDPGETYLKHEVKKRRWETNSYNFKNQFQNSKRFMKTESYTSEKSKWRNNLPPRVPYYSKQKEMKPFSSATYHSKNKEDNNYVSNSTAVPNASEQVYKVPENKEINEKQGNSSKPVPEKKVKTTNYCPDPKVQAANALLNKIRKKQSSFLKKKQVNDVTSNVNTETVKECPLCHNIPKSKINVASKECQTVPSSTSQICETSENIKTQVHGKNNLSDSNPHLQSIATLCRFDGNDEHPWLMYYSQNPWQEQIRPTKGDRIPLSLGGGFTKSEFIAMSKDPKACTSEEKPASNALKKNEMLNCVNKISDKIVCAVKGNSSPRVIGNKVQQRYSVSTLCRFDGDDEHPWIMYFSKNPWHKQASSLKGVPIPSSLGGGLKKPEEKLLNQITDEETISDSENIDEMLFNKSSVATVRQNVATLCRFDDDDDDEPWVLYFSRNPWRKQVRPTKGVPIPLSLGGGFKKSEFLIKAAAAKNAGKFVNTVTNIRKEDETINKDCKDMPNTEILVNKDESTDSNCENPEKTLTTNNKETKSSPSIAEKKKQWCSASTVSV